jgi:DNA-binding MarR family transcriptional regulator
MRNDGFPNPDSAFPGGRPRPGYWTEVLRVWFRPIYGKLICFDKTNSRADTPAVPSVQEAARGVIALYPRIYFACHTRHVRDPQTDRLLSRHQASILDHLDEVDPVTLNELARHMGVTAATMSLSIDRLEKKGYVVRLRDVTDRRRVHMRLTTAGVRVRQASSVLDPARVEALVARLSDEERDLAVKGLGLLAKAGEGLSAVSSQPSAKSPSTIRGTS